MSVWRLCPDVGKANGRHASRIVCRVYSCNDVLRFHKLLFRMLGTFLLICFVSALIITAIHNQFYEPESIIFFVPLYLDNFLIKHNLHILAKPLYECMICMSSFWGASLFVIFSAVFSEVNLLHAICAIPVTAGMLVIIQSLLILREISEDDITHI